MLRVSLWCLLVLSTQVIAILMWGEFVWLSKFANGSVGGTPLGQVQPIFWWIIVIEIIFSIILLVKSSNKKIV